MIKYFCDVCEDEVDKDNSLQELSVTKSSITQDSQETLIITQICESCMKKFEEDPPRRLQRLIRGY